MTTPLLGPTAIGIDMGEDHLKLALLRRGLRKKIIIVGLLTQPLEAGVIDQGIIKNQTAFSQVVSEGIKKFHLHIPDVIASISIPEEKVYVTSVPMNGEIDTQNLSQITEQNFPIQAKDAEIRSAELHSELHGKRLVLAATEKKHIVSLLSACDKMHLRVGAVEFDAIALVRLLRFDGGWPDFLLVLDVGARHATITAMNAKLGIFASANLSSLSGEILTQAISYSMHITPDQAELLKRQHGVEFSPEQQTGVFQALQPLMSQLSKEVHTFFQFLSSHHSILIPEDIPMIMVGGGAQTVGLADYLRAPLSRPVQAWQPSSHFRLIPRIPKEAYASFAVSLGTALRILSYE